METKTKKPRSAPHVWKPFWKLREDQEFYIGKKLFFRISLCKAKEVGFGGKEIYVFPWRRVRTTELIKPALPPGYEMVVDAHPLKFGETVQIHESYKTASPYPVIFPHGVGQCKDFHCPRVETADPAPIKPSYGPSC